MCQILCAKLRDSDWNILLVTRKVAVGTVKLVYSSCLDVTLWKDGKRLEGV